MTSATADKPTRLTADKLVQFRLPLNVYDDVEKRALAAGHKSISLYARAILSTHIGMDLAPPRQAGESSVAALSDERKAGLVTISRAASLLNQIARKLNSGDPLDQAMARQIAQSLDLLDAGARSIRID